MVELPACRWRGEVLADGRRQCLSNKILAPAGVSAATCRGCSLCDHEPAPPRAPRSQPPPRVPHCTDQTEAKIHPGMCHRVLIREIERRRPGGGWPADWQQWDVTKTAHRLLLDAAVAQLGQTPYPENRFHGRGIVIPAGGWCRNVYSPEPQPYFWCAYAAAYTLRRRGCLLPIQFWFLAGEIEPWMLPHAVRVGAGCVDAGAIGVQATMRCPGGWQLKVHALIHCPWREVIHVDADNIAAINPEALFEEPGYVETGALFWADNPTHWSGHLKSHHWQRLGMPDVGDERDFETGQIVVDKARCWNALQICKHLADHADYWGGFNGGDPGVWYGDKTDFHAAWRKTRTPYHLYTGWEWNIGGFYMHRRANGDLVWQHCCHKKGHLVNGHHIHNLKGNEHVWESVRFKGPVPWADGSIEETDRVVNPERHFDIYLGDRGMSRTVWLDVVARNEYRLPDQFGPADVIIDIGANVGAFSYACLRRGAGTVLAFEPFPTSADKAERNVRPWVRNQMWELHRCAVWRSDQPAAEIPLHPHLGAEFPAGFSTVLTQSDPGWRVPAVALDTVLATVDRVAVLKLDCEGAEWPILFTSRHLHQCDAIIGEYHADAVPALAGEPVDSPHPWSTDGLRAMLEGQGFHVAIEPHSDVHGLFWANR